MVDVHCFYDVVTFALLRYFFERSKIEKLSCGASRKCTNSYVDLKRGQNRALSSQKETISSVRKKWRKLYLKSREEIIIHK
jgi:hypothetical protein